MQQPGASQQYPEYQFATHKGYGTKLHRKNIQKHGPCDAHRRSFRLAAR